MNQTDLYLFSLNLSKYPQLKLGHIGFYPYDFAKVNKPLLIKTQNNAIATKILDSLLSALETYSALKNPTEYEKLPSQYKGKLMTGKEPHEIRAQIITQLEILNFTYEDYSDYYDECYDIINDFQRTTITKIDTWKNLISSKNQILYTSAITIIKGGKYKSLKAEILQNKNHLKQSIAMERNISEMLFISKCPTQSCMEDNTIHQWKHICGEILKITVDGIIKCSSCDFQCKFMEYKFNCNRHRPENAYTSAAIKCILSLSDNPTFIQNITGSIMEQQNEIYNSEINSNESDDNNDGINNDDILITQCPVGDGCTQTFYQWAHINCEGFVILEKGGMIKCLKCQKSEKIWNCRFACQNHQYKESSFLGIMYVFNELIIQTKVVEKQKMIIELVNEIPKQFLL